MSRAPALAAMLLAVLATPAASAFALPDNVGLAPPGALVMEGMADLAPTVPGAAGAALDEGEESTATCLLGRPALYCADATSAVTLDCAVNATHYRCDVTASHAAAGSTRGAAPGELLAPSDVEVGVCNGAGLCDQVRTPVGSPCAWEWGARGCATEGGFATTVEGALEGCLFVWVYQDVRAYVRHPGADLDLVQDQAGALAEFDSCAA